MLSFWIILGTFGLIFLPLMIMFIMCGADTAHKVWGAIACLFFWSLISIGLFVDSSTKADSWNGGYCDCGTHWELRGATKSRTGTETKYYACPNCHAEIKQ